MPRYLLLLFVLIGVVLLAVALGACSEIQRTSWQLMTQPEDTDTTLELGVFVAGCDKFAHFRVRETEVGVTGQLLVDSVTIEAYVHDGARSDCDDGIFLEERTVELNAPLGNRPLKGCNPPSAIYGASDYPPDHDCAYGEGD